VITLLDLVLLIGFCGLGVLIGLLTGLLPGLHVNNVALILLSLSGTIVAVCNPLFAYGVSHQFVLVLICGLIISVSLSHAFHQNLPSTFVGAPNEETAMSVLPAHRLLLKGEGYKAVSLSVLGCIGALLTCLAVFFPLRFILGSPLNLYSVFREVMVWILIAIVFLLIGTEKTRITEGGLQGKASIVAGMLFAVFVLLLSGLFGLLLFNLSVTSPIGLPAPLLFPALAGLFGVPTLLTSLFIRPMIPEQSIEPLCLNRIERKSSILSVLTGSAAGIFVSIIPGLTTATGTVLAMNVRQKSSTEQTIVTLASVNTATAFFVVIVLFVIMKARSGVTIAISSLIPTEPWVDILMPATLAYLLMFLVLSGCLSYFSTLYLGKLFAQKFSHIPYLPLVSLTLLFIVSLVILFTGALGLVIFLVGTCIGFLPICWGVRRSHCMGVLLIPIILYFL
jgi:putative membrane protein